MLLAGALVLAALAPPAASAGNFAYTYDALGRLSTVANPNGLVTSYAYDAAGNRTQYAVAAIAALTLSPASLGTLIVGQTVNQTITASGGVQPVSLALSGALPPGLAFSAGQISGAPTQAGTYTFTVTATDARGATASINYSWPVVSTLSITTNSLAPMAINQAYSATISTSGGTSPITFSLASGSLPPKLMLSTAGVLSGTPTTAGNYAFTILARDAMGQTASQPYAQTVPLIAASLSYRLTSDMTSTTVDPAGVDSTYNNNEPLTLASITQPNDGNATISNNKLIYYLSGDVGNFSMNYVVTDSSGNSGTGVITFQVSVHCTAPCP